MEFPGPMMIIAHNVVFQFLNGLAAVPFLVGAGS